MNMFVALILCISVNVISKCDPYKRVYNIGLISYPGFPQDNLIPLITTVNKYMKTHGFNYEYEMINGFIESGARFQQDLIDFTQNQSIDFLIIYTDVPDVLNAAIASKITQTSTFSATKSIALGALSGIGISDYMHFGTIYNDEKITQLYNILQLGSAKSALVAVPFDDFLVYTPKQFDKAEEMFEKFNHTSQFTSFEEYIFYENNHVIDGQGDEVTFKNFLSK